MEDQQFKVLYQEKSLLIKKYLSSIGCSKEDADDIIQEAFIKVITYEVHLEEKNLSAWLFKVSLNHYYDLCRKQKRRPQIQMEEECFINLMTEEAVDIQSILHQDLRSKMLEVLEALNPLYKNLLLMKYEMELSYREISQILDMKEDKIKTYLHRARTTFKKNWEVK